MLLEDLYVRILIAQIPHCTFYELRIYSECMKLTHVGEVMSESLSARIFFSRKVLNGF